MPSIFFVSPDQDPVEVQANVGSSVMHVAQLSRVDGILGECGGAAACATCHVYVDETFVDRLPMMDIQEDEMLAFVATERRPNSRLSCQIPMTEALDGLVIHLPERQF